MEKTAQDVINEMTEKRLTTLERVSGETSLAVERLALSVGLMAKVFMGAGGLIGLTVLGALLHLVIKGPIHG